MSQPRQTLEQIFEAQVQTLSLTLQPFTVVKYEYVARRFVGYLRATFPEVHRLSQLRRDPHMLGWFRWLCELRPPVGNHTREQRLLCLRRLLHDLAARAIPSSLALSSAKISRFVPSISPGLCLWKTINDCKRNCTGPTACIPMPSCWLASPGSGLENASTCPSIVCVTSRPNNGHCTFLSASFTPSASCPSILKDGGC